MNVQILRALQKMKDSQAIKKASTTLTESAYRVNQYLTPEALKTVETRELRATFIKVSLRHIYSIKDAGEVAQIVGKVRDLENRAIGGGWL